MQISIKNRNYFALSAVSFLHLFVCSAAMLFFAIWLGQHLGIGATKTGLLYSANALAALCMQPVLGFISDKIGLKKTLLKQITNETYSSDQTETLKDIYDFINN